MSKEDILNYVKGYYKTYRQTKNGLFIYSGLKLNSIRYGKFDIYTYISNEDINRSNYDTINFIKEGLNYYIEDVIRHGGKKNEI